MILDLSSLNKAINQLETTLKYCNSDLAKNNHDIALLFRAAAIQAFEFTYELCYKMLKRYLENTEPNAADIDRLSFSNIIRLGNERGLLHSDLKTWTIYRECRNNTSYTYDEDRAEQVYLKLGPFLDEAKYLLQELNKRMNK